MRYIKLIVPALLMMLVISCGNMSNKDNGEGNGNTEAPKQFKSAADAATAAREDMMAAMDKVDFGVSRDQLKNAAPGAPSVKYTINWDALLQSTGIISPENIVEKDAATIVPLVNANNVVTVITLKGNDQQYSVAAIGDKQISSELDMVRKADSMGMLTDINIYEVPNLQATIYAVGKGERAMYYTSYNGNSIRQGMDGASLFKMISAEAAVFQRKYGDEIKKGKLVR